jgi:hypothetical protein
LVSRFQLHHSGGTTWRFWLNIYLAVMLFCPLFSYGLLGTIAIAQQGAGRSFWLGESG